ncbi:MAG TPA: MFS transporter [Feifaniaceae bacterium]|nr:MFS transporter [Feifaniaceae bacterium]
MKQGKLGVRVWLGLLMFGLFGQLAWMVENMYLNVFVFNTISGDPGVIANMVAASAVTATLTTLLIGALTDKLGRRKAFISAGYILWGLSTMAFGAITVQNAQALFPGAAAAQVAATLVILTDCVMTFFGSGANDAAFNAWVTDVTSAENRGRVEGVLSSLPLVAMLIIFVGLDGLTQRGDWPMFFNIVGGVVTLGGVCGLFLLKDSPSLEKSTAGYLPGIVYGFRAGVVRKHPPLYLSLCALGVAGASTQIFMPYLLIYIQKSLNVPNYTLLLGAVLIAASLISVVCGRLIDKIGKLNFIFAAIALEFAGLLLMYAAVDPAFVAAAGIVMIGGNMLLLATVNALVRDYTPEDKAGHFQGIRMLFAVLLPMVTGPYIGAAVIRGSGRTYVDLGVVKQVPTADIFLAAAILLLLIFVPVAFLRRGEKKRAAGRAHTLYTPWGETLDPDHVLQEYPRPQMKRESYFNLNGIWEYAVTKGEHAPETYDGSILVPFSPESALSGVNRQLLPGETLWYRRTAALPEGFLKERLLLHFGAVDQCCEVFIDGVSAGGHEGGYLPFALDVTELIKKQGAHTVTVKVRDASNTSARHAYGKQSLKRGGIWYTAQSGIWQTVWMESVPANYIGRLVITPLFDDAAVEVRAAMREGAVPGTVTVFYGEDKIATGELDASGAARIPLPGFRAWSPEDPFLYGLAVETAEDRVESYFGMRKFGAAPDENGVMRLELNNRPYYQNGLLDQGYWSDGLYTAPSDEALIYDIRTMKEAGFNMLRKHIKIEPLRWYYHCDRLGMLVWQDMVSGGGPYKPFITQALPFLGARLNDRRYRLFGRANAEGRRQFLQDMEGTVRHLYNAVGLYLWAPFNEGWGQFDANETAERLRALDFTRVIDHASGWYDQGGGDVKSLHVYFKKVRIPKEEKRALILSEFGGYSFGVPGHRFSDGVYGYRLYSAADALTEGYRSLIAREIVPAIRKGLSASVYTQVSDVEEELNGILTYDRRTLKISREILSGIHRKLTFHEEA